MRTADLDVDDQTLGRLTPWPAPTGRALQITSDRIRDFHATRRAQIRLLQLSDAGKISLTDDLKRDVPPYAILSHTWGPDSDEVSFEDLVKGTGAGKRGYRKLRFCAEQARRDELHYFWVDTCCIDKPNHTELHEAINSMFRWYQESARCYVHMADVSAPSSGDDNSALSSAAWDATFRSSRWFTRGWTLQELLAPSSVEFFSHDGRRLGDQLSFRRQIHEATGIAPETLEGRPVSEFEVEERFRWAKTRQTKREEDKAYSLLGIFGVFMPLIYGEGEAHAMRRLRREIELSRSQHGRSLTLSESVARPSFHVPFAENQLFVGRSSIMRKLQEQAVISTAQSRIALYGLGGIGKTQIALAHTYWFRRQQPDVSVFWIHASSADRFRQGFAAIAQEHQIPGYDDPKVDVMLMVKSWLLGKKSGRWLMVLDNADDLSLFSKPSSHSEEGPIEPATVTQSINLGSYVPDCAHGSVLVTTRNKQVASRLCRGGTLLAVEQMETDESERFLRSKIEQTNLGSAELGELSTALDHLPLAMVQAAAFMQENTMSVRDYLELLRGNDQNLVDLLSEEFETVGRDSETPRAVTSAWIISFQQIGTMGRAGLILSLLSMFDYQNVPVEWVDWFCQEYPDEEGVYPPYNKVQLQKDLGTLKAFCFVTTSDNGKISMHRLVQLVARKALARTGRLEELADQALYTVAHQYPFGSFDNRVACAENLPHAYAVLSHQDSSTTHMMQCRSAVLHNVAAHLALERLRLPEAAAFQEQAVALSKAVCEPGDSHTLMCIGSLGFIYEMQGRLTEAVNLLLPVFEQCQQAYPEHDDSMAFFRNALATAYGSLGRLDLAEELQARNVELATKMLGEDHPDTLNYVSFLAVTIGERGRLDMAESLQLRILECYRKECGEEATQTLSIMQELTDTYRSQGRWAEAAAMGEQVLETQMRLVGDTHRSSLNSMFNLANTYFTQGRDLDALPLLEHVSRSYHDLLGEDHAESLAASLELARVYSRTSRWVEAEELGTQALAGLTQRDGEGHLRVLRATVYMGGIYSDQGKMDEALELIQRGVEAQTRAWEAAGGGDKPVDLLHSTLLLSGVYWRMGLVAESEEALMLALEPCKRALGEDHPTALLAQASQAMVFWERGRQEEAKAMMRSVITRGEAVGHSENHSPINELEEWLKLWESGQRFPMSKNQFRGHRWIGL